MTDLSTEIQFIKGVGEARAKAMAKLGIRTLRDLVCFFPRAYEDRTVIKSISELIPGDTVCVRAIAASEPRLAHIRRGLDLVKLRAVDEAGSIDITFFNQGYIKDAIKQGVSYIFYGKVSGTLSRLELTNPLFEREDSAGTVTGRIVPVYPLTAGISQKVLSGAVRQGLDACQDVLPDYLPDVVRQKYRLAQTRYAFENVHFPADFQSLEIARRRLVFEELFVLASAMSLMRGRRTAKKNRALVKHDLSPFFDALPFELTGAQKRAVADAVSDMTCDTPMNRLIQGDVGSGKTVVAAAACWLAWKNGCQSAFMAPTEILAGQHYRTLTGLLEPFGIHVGLLTGSMTAKRRRDVLSSLKLGETDVIVGTHALLTGDVDFFDLSLVITDEQHRFGVVQRAALTQKGDSPNVLVMSATPIPRTLALIIYGDLDVSIIDELPPGRQKIDTFAVGEKLRPRVYRFISKLVGEGRQVYVVCPMVESGEQSDDDLKAAEEYSKALQTEIFPQMRVALIHGRMKARDKDAVMTAFAAGETDILVATTVIEVGVDVPNAALIVVENADRFGLSQLHQLRGRVGRGEHKSYCILFEGAGGETSRQRLRVMCETNDGFKIAEEDLRLRGPGDFFGSRQHGLPEMRVADISADMNVLREAQDAANEVLMADPQLTEPENAALSQRIHQLFELSDATLN